MMKLIVTLFSAFILGAPFAAPALAQKNSGGNASERSEAASSNSSGNTGSERSEAASGNSSNNGGNAGGGNGNSGNSNAGGGSGNSGNRGQAGDAAGRGPDPDGIVQLPREQQLVQSAVRAGAALPLEEILAIVEKDSQGRVLDLELVRFNGSYLYAVTVLERNGILHKLYYYARSGRRVRTN